MNPADEKATAIHVYCDESGNTGTALLDPEQPIFSLASTCIEPHRARQLLEPLIRQGQQEVKYAKLKGSTRGQAQLINLFSLPELHPGNCRFTVTDKRFYLVSHLVDKLIEPSLHEANIDLYARDAHVALANIWYFAGDLILPNGHWRRVLKEFLSAIRRCDATAFFQFDAVLTTAAADANPGYGDLVNGLLLCRGRLEEYIGVFRDVEAFDPAVDAFSLLIHKWMADHSGRFPVTHDQSKPLKRNEKLLRALMSQAATRVIGYGQRQHELPLRISTLAFGDSRVVASLQIADLIAGAAVDYLKSALRKQPLTDYQKVLQTVLFPLYVGGMLPTLETAEVADPLPGQRNLPEGAAQFLKEVGFFDSIPK
jgi:hypothetical protein